MNKLKKKLLNVLRRRNQSRITLEYEHEGERYYICIIIRFRTKSNENIDNCCKNVVIVVMLQLVGI